MVANVDDEMGGAATTSLGTRASVSDVHSPFLQQDEVSTMRVDRR